ncbi:MAG: GNAT family N-acetyltransferase [Chloroflexota bacterium]|nr:GNAT family N-acetyltransferase [Chloroflexota bacterium]
MSNIRPFTVADYLALVTVINSADPEHMEHGTAISVAEMQLKDEQRDAKCRFQRWVAEIDGKVIAVGQYDQFADMYHPRQFWVYLVVAAQYQGRGIGSALYQHVASGLDPLQPLEVRAEVREDMTQSVRFAKAQGFQEEWGRWESHLDIAAFAEAPYRELEARLQAAGIEIKAANALAGDAERDRKLYTLSAQLTADVPFPPALQRTDIGYETFVEDELRLPEAYFVAVRAGEYIGLCSLLPPAEGNDAISIAMTGVKRSYRGRGIALALKLHAIRYAKAHGYRALRTWNDSVNEGILRHNTRLGFVRDPAWIIFVKR